MGHIDAGKTAVARCLTEIVSTAGLDKHIQAQERGITIDLGFTFFQLENFLITLVDSPGHADLIQAVVSAANIIDLAFIVVDATHGPQIQTGEHLLILDTLQIPEIFILINKIDAVDVNQLQKVEKQVQSILAGTRYKNSNHIFQVSAQNKIGFEKIKEELLHYLKENPPKRNMTGPFRFVFDHHFGKKGQGTILTGNVLLGNAKVGDEITILPPDLHSKIKSIQIAKQNSESMQAGDRCGIGVVEIDSNALFRGCFVVKDKTPFIKSEIFEIEFSKILLYKQPIMFGQQFSINIGMRSIRGRLFPFTYIPQDQKKTRIRCDFDIDIQQGRALMWLESSEYIQLGDMALITRMDLPPNSLRIVGSGKIITSATGPLIIGKIRTKSGEVKHPDYSPKTVIVDGLAQSKEGALSILNSFCKSPYGKILKSFGSKGAVEVEYHGLTPPPKGEKVELQLIKEFTLEKDAVY